MEPTTEVRKHGQEPWRYNPKVPLFSTVFQDRQSFENKEQKTDHSHHPQKQILAGLKMKQTEATIQV